MKRGGRFCSLRCSSISQQSRVKKTCLTCGCEFEIPVSHELVGYGKFCSRDCHHKSMEGGVPWNRGLTGLQTAWNKGKKMTLSEESREKMRQAHRGKRPWNKVGENGITPENIKLRNSPRFQAWRNEVFSRDNWTCQRCGERGVHLHAHHICNFAAYPELRFVVDNGATLCKPCHKDFHRRYGQKKVKTNREQLKEFLLVKLTTV